MSNIRLTISYDGSRYYGFQRQTGKPTVQQKLEDALTDIIGSPIQITASGRTDAGVHAMAQTVNFHTDTSLSPDEIFRLLNNKLPSDIAVREAKYASERFHSRYNVLKKVYTYRINTSGFSNVFEKKYVFDFFESLDINKMREASELLMGTHDFIGFSSVKKTKKSTVRKIFDIVFTEKSGELDITYTASGYLHNMVRIITGTLIEIGAGYKEISVINEVFETGDRSTAGFTAPAKGLIMEYAVY